MGWNDHVEFVPMQCRKCGTVADWEYWDEVAKRRYVGAIGDKLGRDVAKSDRCPHCGSAEGDPVEDEDREGWG